MRARLNRLQCGACRVLCSAQVGLHSAVPGRADVGVPAGCCHAAFGSVCGLDGRDEGYVGSPRVSCASPLASFDSLTQKRGLRLCLSRGL